MQLGLLAINRKSFLTRLNAMPRLECRRPSICSVEDALARYRGIEGDLWPEGGPDWGESSLLAPTTAIDDPKFWLGGQLGPDIELLCVAIPQSPQDFIAPADFSELGFDVGYLESKWSHYSAIFNEVLFGVDPKLRALANDLNANLLGPDLRKAEQILEARQEAISRGADLEEVGTMALIQVFGRIHPAS